MTDCQKKAKSVLYNLDLFSPSKRVSSNDINSWNQTHDKKVKYQWTSSKKKKNTQKQINNIENLKKNLSIKLQKSTPTTCRGRDSQLSPLEYQLINTRAKISQFKLPEFANKENKRISLPKPQSKSHKLNTKCNWNKVSNPPTGRRQTKQMIERQIRQHLEQMKKPIVVRKIMQNNRFLSLISKAGIGR